jgi:SIR2-like domain
VLLGAGASQEAGVPTTFDMTESLVRRVSQNQSALHPTVQALNFVCGALLAHDAAKGMSPFSGLDVERVFAAVELLAERDTLEVSPFVASWHPAVDVLDNRGFSMPGSFNRRLKSALEDSPSYGGAQQLITELIDSRTGSAADGHTYRELAMTMVDELRALVATTAKEVGYLSPLASAGRDAGGLTVVSLNYDLAVEQVAESAATPCTTGIAGWLDSGRWEWPEAGIRLLKLHGSIDWRWVQTDPEIGHLPQRVLEVDDGTERRDSRPAVVFGQRGKLQAAGPFLGLLAEFEKLLANAERLVVIGYSFRDEHVNEVIGRWTAEGLERKLCVVDPHWPEQFPLPQHRDFRGKLQLYLGSNDTSENSRAEPRLEVRRDTCAKALPSLF